jgi:hypothetical protein
VRGFIKDIWFPAVADMPSVRRKVRFLGQTAFWPLRLPSTPQITSGRDSQRRGRGKGGVGGRPGGGNTQEGRGSERGEGGLREWQICQESARELAPAITRRHISVRYPLRLGDRDVGAASDGGGGMSRTFRLASVARGAGSADGGGEQLVGGEEEVGGSHLRGGREGARELVWRLIGKRRVTWSMFKAAERQGFVTGLESCCESEGRDDRGGWGGGEYQHGNRSVVVAGGVLVTVVVEVEGGGVGGMGREGGRLSMAGSGVAGVGREEEKDGMCVHLVCVVTTGDEVQSRDSMQTGGGGGGIEEGGACGVVAEEVEEEMFGGDAVVRACARAQELVGLQSLLC